MFSRSKVLLAAASFAFASAGAHAQFKMLHVGDVSAGGTGQFSTLLYTDPTPKPLGAQYPTTTAYPYAQYTTLSAGFLGSMQMHPVSWAGIQVNYGFTHYQERFGVGFTGGGQKLVPVSTDMHEATAGYLLHPKHIPFQPYFVVGGGAIDFNPRGGATASSPVTGTHQWRGAGYVETGFDLPTHSKHVGFRIAGRTLIYRSPNFTTPALSFTSWRSTEEPEVAVVYKF